MLGPFSLNKTATLQLYKLYNLQLYNLTIYQLYNSQLTAYNFTTYNFTTLQLTTLQLYNLFHDFSYDILSQLILLFSTNYRAQRGNFFETYH